MIKKKPIKTKNPPPHDYVNIRSEKEEYIVYLNCVYSYLKNISLR